MKMTVISIVIAALITTFKGLVKGLEDSAINRDHSAIALLRSSRILRRVLET